MEQHEKTMTRSGVLDTAWYTAGAIGLLCAAIELEGVAPNSDEIREAALKDFDRMCGRYKDAVDFCVDNLDTVTAEMVLKKVRYEELSKAYNRTAHKEDYFPKFIYVFDNTRFLRQWLKEMQRASNAPATVTGGTDATRPMSGSRPEKQTAAAPAIPSFRLLRLISRDERRADVREALRKSFLILMENGYLDGSTTEGQWLYVTAGEGDGSGMDRIIWNRPQNTLAKMVGLLERLSGAYEIEAKWVITAEAFTLAGGKSISHKYLKSVYNTIDREDTKGTKELADIIEGCFDFS